MRNAGRHSQVEANHSRRTDDNRQETGNQAIRDSAPGKAQGWTHDNPPGEGRKRTDARYCYLRRQAGRTLSAET